MTREEAARILDPETTFDAYNEITYYGGFNGIKIWLESANEAGRMGAAALRELGVQEKQKPLTINELRQMDGEPVWAVLTVKTVGQKAGYALIYNNCKYATQRWVNIPLWYSEYGEIWIAYRHRIEEEM